MSVWIQGIRLEDNNIRGEYIRKIDMYIHGKDTGAVSGSDGWTLSGEAF